MNSVGNLSRIAKFGQKLKINAFMCCLLLIISGCDADRQGDVADEEAPVDPVDEVMLDSNLDVGDEVESGKPFCLKLASARDRVLLGEPLTLIVTLQNCSDETMKVRDLLRPDYGLLGVRFEHPQHDQEQLYYPLVRREGRGKGYVELAAGDVLAATVAVYFGRDGWQLDAPGTYKFQADYSVDEISLTSNAVTVNIEVPPGEADLSAAQIFMSADAATYYYLGGGDEKGANELRALVADMPDSPWAAYAKLGLAIDSASDRNNSSRAPACRSLEAALDDIEQDWIIALRGYETLSSCLKESGLESEISRVTADFVSRHPQAEVTLQARKK